MNVGDMKFRPQIQLRFRDLNQYEMTKERASRAGVSLNEYVVRVLEAVDGDVTSGSTSSSRANLEEASADGRGAGEVQDAYEKRGGVRRAGREKGVRAVRGKVRGHGGRQGAGASNGTGKVLGPSSGAQPDRSAVDGGVQQNSGVQATGYVGKYAHETDCECGHCPKIEAKREGRF